MSEKIRRCKYCDSEIKIKTGLHNWKRLFKKPTLEEFITFFIILMLIISAYAYKSDLNKIIEYYENESYCNQKHNFQIQENINPLNIILNNQNNLIVSPNLSAREGG